MEIADHVALVCGGVNSLGADAARLLEEEGADVAILALDGVAAADLAAEVDGYSQQCDVAKEEHCAVGVSSAMARFGQAPRIVVNCNGLDLTGPVLTPQGKTSIPLFQQMTQVQLIGTFQIMSYAAQAMMDMPSLEDGERGVIINVVSTGFESGPSQSTARTAADAAIAALALPAARDLAEYGIRVVTIAVGSFESEKTQELGSNAKAAMVEGIPFPKRLGNGSDFKGLLKAIIGSPYINGTTIHMDGASRK